MTGPCATPLDRPDGTHRVARWCCVAALFAVAALKWTSSPPRSVPGSSIESLLGSPALHVVAAVLETTLALAMSTSAWRWSASCTLVWCSALAGFLVVAAGLGVDSSACGCLGDGPSSLAARAATVVGIGLLAAAALRESRFPPSDTAPAMAES